jgi:hypothetical protein
VSSGCLLTLRRNIIVRFRAEVTDSILKTEAACSSEMLVYNQEIAWYNNPEEYNLNSHHSENFKITLALTGPELNPR